MLPNPYPMIRIIITSVMFIVCATCHASLAKADQLYGDFIWSNFKYEFKVGNMTLTYWLGEISGGIQGSDEKLQFYCGDILTQISDDFKDPAVGHPYAGTLLASSTEINSTQIHALQELFNHVYSPLLQAKASFAALNSAAPEWKAERDAVDVLNSALQIAVWEIMHESSAGNWNIRDWDITKGNFKVNSASNSGLYESTLTTQQMLDEIVSLTDSWFASIESGTWDARFAKNMSYEITYYSWIDNPSQNLLLAVRDPSSNNGVPEPATILLWTLGTLCAAGASWTRKTHPQENPGCIIGKKQEFCCKIGKKQA